MKLKQITKHRFLALTEGRLFQTDAREVEWWADDQERVLGLLLLDAHDEDWSWVVLGRDEVGNFRGIDLETSVSDQDEARTRMQTKLAQYAASGQTVFPQGDRT
jgi:hypothetical protein